jgi:UDP-N-acetylmuramoyl-tripeptide--D-alanyl-D-alanine ligase
MGDMLELGGNEAELHRMIGVQAAQVADRLYLYGSLTAFSAEGAISAGMPIAAVIQGLSHDEIADDIVLNATEGDFVLMKGSRCMKMENIAEKIKAKFR